MKLKIKYFLIIFLIYITLEILFNILSCTQNKNPLETTSVDLLKIIFMTRRDGNYEIYMMNEDGSSQNNLSQNSAEDINPRFSADGKKIVFASDRMGRFHIYTMDINGDNQSLLTPDKVSVWAVFSPNCSKISFVSNGDIYIMDSDGENQINLTNSNRLDFFPEFSPDGSNIVFESSDYDFSSVYIIDTNGQNQTRLTDSQLPNSHSPFPQFSPDGTQIAYSFNNDIYLMSIDGSEKINLTNNSSEDLNPVFTSDGSKIAFISDLDGNFDIYMMECDGSNPVNLTNDNRLNGSPCISMDGSKIVYQSAESIGYDTEIYIINTDGTMKKGLTSNSFTDINPLFKPFM